MTNSTLTLSHFSLLVSQLASMKSWRDMRAEIQYLTANATRSPSHMYQAVSRIVCGHPEGGGLKIKSLNWYEDNNYKALFGNYGNSSEDEPVSAYDNTSSEFSSFTQLPSIHLFISPSSLWMELVQSILFYLLLCVNVIKCPMSLFCMLSLTLSLFNNILSLSCPSSLLQ